MPELMRLQLPTDRLILGALSEGRNLAVNIAQENDRSRHYVSRRLAQLYDYGLVAKVGPAKDSGLYEITPLGVAAYKLADQYGEVTDFEALIEDRAEAIEVRGFTVIDHAE